MTARDGYCRGAIRSGASALAITLAPLALAPANAAPTSIIDIPDATLDVAVLVLARQSGAEIVSTEQGLNRVRSRPVRGRLPVAVALEQLLAGTPFAARRLGNGAYVIRRRPIRAPLPVRPPAPRLTAVPHRAPPEPAPAIVIVQASKQQTPLIRYPGTVTSVRMVDPLGAGSGGRSRDLSDLGQTLPVLQGTHLGPGRDKLFIRGIADSSFSGSTQSPTSLYWDDVQLNYTGPDPGLRLYDVASVDVLEGPQGTLYGSGAIGGVIRVNSNPVDLQAPSGAASIGFTATQNGKPGGDAAGMVNMPLISGKLGLRAVGYISQDGGYLDDLRRGRSDINRTTTKGGRLTLRFRPSASWQFEAGGVIQAIRSRDGQYALSSAPPLTRLSSIAQPYSNQLALGRLSVSHRLGNGLQFHATTAVVGYHSTDQFDATTLSGPLPVTYVADRHKRLLSHESRLSRSLTSGASWVVGLSLIKNTDRLARTFVFVDLPLSVTGVTNRTSSVSGFVEGTRPLSDRLSATLGARFTSARVDGDPSVRPTAGSFVRGHTTRRVDPTLALVWKVQPDTTIFGRVQSGFRTGGLAVAPGIGRVSDFETDMVRMAEVGVRHLRRGVTGLSYGSTLSVTQWNDIQADLITRRGAPTTLNLGNARILSWEGNAEWVPLPDFSAKGSFLVSRNRVNGPMASLSQRRNRRLPDTPLFSASGELSYRWSAVAGQPSVRVSGSYVGRSVLGTGDLFDIAQGRYLLLDAGAGVDWRGLHWSLWAENLGNAAANRFSFGNPFTLAARNQITPLRPRSVRLGVSTRW